MLEVIAGMATLGNRYLYAKKLAAYFNCTELIIFIKDPEIDILLPAPGFPQTLPLNSHWNEFLAQSLKVRFYVGSLPYPDKNTATTATGIAGHDESVAILLGGNPDDKQTAPFAAILPVLTTLFLQEQKTIAAQTMSLFAEKSTRKAEKLANTLDNTRLKLKEALVKQEIDKHAIEVLLEKKDEFLNIASHELKTPITSLKASLQLLDRIKDNPPPLMLARLIEQSNKSMEKINGLIDDLLNVIRINEGQLHLEKTTFNIADMLKVSCNHIRIPGKYNLVLGGDETLTVQADEHRIDQVIVNFVNNAVKYAPEEKTIYLTISTEGKMAKVSVTDSGPGIAVDKIPHLFDRYYRGDYTGAQYSGLGLGLYICAEIIKRHNGQIGVITEPGKGSTFWFTLPLEEAAE